MNEKQRTATKPICGMV